MILPIDVRGPFHLEATVRLLQRRPANRVDVFEDGAWQRLLFVGGELVLVRVRNAGSVEHPSLVAETTFAGDGPTHLASFVVPVLRRMLGLDVDTSAFDRLVRGEPRLAPLASKLRGMRPPRFPTLFETFANVIPFQQVSLDSGAAIVGKLVAALGPRRDLEGRSWHAFPEATAIAEARPALLRSAGLSGRKASALRGVAREIAAGTLTEGAIEATPTSHALHRLLALPGIGPWSAGLVLLRGFGRMDAFPSGDVGVARGLSRILGIEADSHVVEEFASRFGAQQGLLYFFSLGAQLLARGLIHEAPPSSSFRNR